MSDFVKDFVMEQPNVKGKIGEKEEQKELNVEKLIITAKEKESTGPITEKMAENSKIIYESSESSSDEKIPNKKLDYSSPEEIPKNKNKASSSQSTSEEDIPKNRNKINEENSESFEELTKKEEKSEKSNITEDNPPDEYANEINFISQESDDDEDDGNNEIADEDCEHKDGFWLDDPRPDIYVPHLTILKTDPKWDKKLRMNLNGRRGRGGGKPKKRKGGREGDGGRGGGGRGDPKEPFGWSFSLLRDIRIEFSKMEFGVQHIGHVELQYQFKSVLSISLN